MSLYELQGQYAQLLEKIEQETTETGEADNWLFAELSAVEDDIEKKFENYGKIIRNQEAEKAGLKNEGIRLLDRAKVIENKVDRLKSYMRDTMIQLGLDKIKGEILTITLKKPTQKIDVIKSFRIPEKYWVQQEPRLDKKTLTIDLKDGINIPGARLVDGQRAILIR